MTLVIPEIPNLLGSFVTNPQLAVAEYDTALAGISRVAADCTKTVWQEAEETGDAVLLILRIWEATAHAIMKDLESGKNVLLPPLGVFKSKSVRGSLGTSIVPDDEEGLLSILPSLQLSDEFADRYGLASDPASYEEVPNGPHIRFSVMGVARTAEINKQVVQKTLAAVMHRMGEIMGQDRQVIISFAPVGIICSRDQVVTFEAGLKDFGTSADRYNLSVRNMVATNHHQQQLHVAAAKAICAPSLPFRKPRASGGSGGTQRKSGRGFRQRILHLSAARLQSAVAEDVDATEETRNVMQGTFHRMLPEHSVQFPPLLNECSRTLAVPYTGAQDPGCPSGRIAANYTNATWLTSKLPGLSSHSLQWGPSAEEISPPLPKKSHDYASLFANQYIEDGSPLHAEIREAGMEKDGFYECLHRYNHYLSNSVPSTYIAPYNPIWMNNIGTLLDARHFIAELCASDVDDMMSEMHEEVLQDYHHAIRKSIVDYIFEDEKARRRAGVLFVPCPPVSWGTVPFVGVEGTHGGPPEEWRSGLRESRACIASALATCSQSSLKLLELWHDQFDGLLLVALPARANDENIELSAFCSAQSCHHASVRREFDQVWLDAVVEILRSRRIEESTPTHEASFYEAVSALLSTQARGIIERSIDAYVGFFSRFAKEAPMTPQQVVQLSGTDEREDAFFILGLTAEFDDIRFSTPLEQVSTSLLGVFRDFVMCLRSLERPDAKLGKTRCSSRYLWEVSLEEKHVVRAERFISDVININIVNAEQALTLYDDYKHLLHEEARTRELVENLTLTREDYMAEVDKLRATESAIRDKCPNQIRLQMIVIDCAELNETLCKKATEAVQILLHAVLRNLLLKNDQLVKAFDTVRNHMVKKPTTEVELVDLESHVVEFRTSGLKGLLGEFESIRSWLNFLFECEDRLCWNLLSDRHYRAIYDSALWVHSIDHIVSDREANLRREREALESKFKEQRNKFIEDLEGLNVNVDKFKDCGNMRQADDYLERMQILRKNFDRAHVEAGKLNDKEERLGWPPSSFDQLKRGEQALEPYHRLWTVAYNLDKATKQWLRGPMFQLDPVKVEAEANSMKLEAVQLRTLFEELDQQIPAGVAAQLELDVSNMTDSHLGLVHSLCNKGLRQRHWEQISEIVGFVMEPDNVFTLSRIDEMGVGKHMAKLHEISDAATKEHEIEVALDMMQAEWKPVQFDLRPWLHTGSFVISRGSVEETKGLVDDHLGKTRVMRTSPHVVPWAQRAADWQAWLELTAEILKYWVRLQSSWTSLEPVFNAQDILRQMPTEGQLFRKVDKAWRALMQATSEQRAVLHVTKEAGIRERLADCCNMLDEVQQGLHDFLEANNTELQQLRSRKVAC